MSSFFQRQLIFFVNGKEVVEGNPNPDITLLQYLRFNLGLTGAKLGCGEGGCGSCTVMLSKCDGKTQRVTHYSVNACLTPLASVHGLAVTTVEGIGSVKTKLHPIQEQLAKTHGSQCGFCTPGFIMSMYALLRTKSNPTMEEIEDNLVGNLCRCTGYRPILEGFRQFSDDVTPAGCGREDCCQLQDTETCQKLETTEIPNDLDIIFPPKLKTMHLNDENVKFEGPQITWFRPIQIEDIWILKSKYPEAKIVGGNTEIGIDRKFINEILRVQIYPKEIQEMNSFKLQSDGFKFGSAVSLSQLEIHLKETMETTERAGGVCLAFLEMLRWFGSKQIRNTATVGGNVMTGSPISDLNPLLLCLNATLHFQTAGKLIDVTMNDDFFTGYRQVNTPREYVLVAISVRFLKKNEYLQVYKQSRRKDDDISIVNSAMLVQYDFDQRIVSNLILVYGGMFYKTVFAKKTMQIVKGLPWTENLFEEASKQLLEDFPLEPDAPGGMVQYRKTLAISVQRWLHSIDSTYANNTNIVDYKNRRPLKSSQYVDQITEKTSKFDTIGSSVLHESGYKHTTGEAVYFDDTLPLKFELHAALVLSTKACAKIVKIDPSSALEMEGVHRFFCAKDLPEDLNKCGFIVEDEELFATEEVHYVGNVIGLIVAESKAQAKAAARCVKVTYETQTPILTIEEAIKKKSFWDPLEFAVGDLAYGFKGSSLILNGDLSLAGQDHFYLETQGSIAIPREGGDMLILSSSQNPSDVQKRVARVIQVPENKVVCTVKRIGGGFGGKETQSGWLATYTGLAASRTGHPVRLTLDRDEDMMVTGSRHPFYAKWKVACTSDGVLQALDIEFYAAGGYSLDVSLPMAMKTIMHLDNTYKIPNVSVKGTVCRTNHSSNTACRGTGAPQIMLIMEDIMDRISRSLNIPIHEIQGKNLYSERNQRSYYGQLFDICPARKCWNTVMEKSNYLHRREQILEFNKNNKYVKRGISIVPTKMGVSYGCSFLEQGAALIMAYRDGSVLLTHGGVEVGQGLHTRMIQVASRELEIPVSQIYIAETSTDKVPNTTPTAASGSSDLNGKAVQDCCRKLKKQLEPYKLKNPSGDWKSWINAAYEDRVPLSATGFYRTPGLTDFQLILNGGDFYSYFTFGAAVSEVEIDVLTGCHKILRTDIVMDAGASVNPAIDIGQIEGAFTYGCGLYTMEEMVYNREGHLLSKGPGTYKLMSVQDVPTEFNVTIIKVSENSRGIYSSRSLGEPPLNLAASVFFAIKDAIYSYRPHQRPFRLNSPASVERIRMACLDDITKKLLQPVITIQGKSNGVQYMLRILYKFLQRRLHSANGS